MKNQKHTPKVFEKKFNSLTEMVLNLRELHPEIKNILPYSDNDKEEEYQITPGDLSTDVLNYFAENSPNLEEKKNLPVNISITSNKAYLKTNKFFSIGWAFKYNKEGEISDVVATVIAFVRDKNLTAIDKLLEALQNENNNWKFVESKYNK